MDLSPFLFRVYRGLFLPFCFLINPYIARYARLMMKQNHQKHPPDILRNKFQTASDPLKARRTNIHEECSLFTRRGDGPLRGKMGRRGIPL